MGHSFCSQGMTEAQALAAHAVLLHGVLPCLLLQPLPREPCL